MLTPIFLLFGQVFFIHALSQDLTQTTSPYDNWQNLLDEVSHAAFSDSASVKLSRIRRQIASEEIEYPLQWDSIRKQRLPFDPEAYITEVEEFLQQMPPATQILYQQEKEFRQSTRIDTTFHVGRAELTGDGNEDSIIARIFKDNHDIYLRYSVVSALDTIQVYQFSCDIPPTWSPLNELSVWYNNALEMAPNVDDDNAKSFFFIPEIMVRAVSDISGKSEEVLLPIITEYIEQYSGRCIGLRDPQGLGGACWVYYEPLRQFVFLYTP